MFFLSPFFPRSLPLFRLIERANTMLCEESSRAISLLVFFENILRKERQTTDGAFAPRGTDSYGIEKEPNFFSRKLSMVSPRSGSSYSLVLSFVSPISTRVCVLPAYSYGLSVNLPVSSRAYNRQEPNHVFSLLVDRRRARCSWRQ